MEKISKYISAFKNRLKLIADNQQSLYIIFICILMFTNVLLLFTERMDIISMIVFITIPLGTQMIILALFNKPGISFLLLLPKIFIDAFQFVLIVLWGGSIIAVDMFINLATTNAGEAMELLNDLIPALAIICLIYISGIVFAIKSISNPVNIDRSFRTKKLKQGVILTVLGLGAMFITIKTGNDFKVKYDLYPNNVFYNLDYAIKKAQRINNYLKTSENFNYNAYRVKNNDPDVNLYGKSAKREIYVLILGETGRAANWSMYGYDRKTTPYLDTLSNVVKFSDMLTQSNTTHKIVSMLLTPADAKHYDQIYHTKSIISAFSQSGFKTVYITNQEYNKTFMQYYFNEADVKVSIRKNKNSKDHQMLPVIEQTIKSDTLNNLFIFIHLYGSHFKYQQRYDKQFAVYEPDNVENISKTSLQRITNSFDNSILSTDDFIYRTIKLIEEDNSRSLVLYLSDHGEDLMDDKRGKFLHASPVPTYYQLHIPYIIWFSDRYIRRYNDKYHQSIDHKDYPLSNNTVFHSMLDFASIKTEYLDFTLSVCSKELITVPRTYLDDHDEPVTIENLKLTKYDYEQFEKRGLKLY